MESQNDSDVYTQATKSKISRTFFAWWSNTHGQPQPQLPHCLSAPQLPRLPNANLDISPSARRRTSNWRRCRSLIRNHRILTCPGARAMFYTFGRSFRGGVVAGAFGVDRRFPVLSTPATTPFSRKIRHAQ